MVEIEYDDDYEEEYEDYDEYEEDEYEYEDEYYVDEYALVEFLKSEEYREQFFAFLSLQLEQATNLSLISDDQDYLQMMKNNEQVYNLFVLMFSVFATLNSIMSNEIRAVYESFDVNLALDDDLDVLGDLLGVERPDAIHSTVLLTFEKYGEHEETVINPPGIIVSTDNDIQYETTEELIFPVGIYEAKVNAVAVIDGFGQTVRAGTLVNIEEGLIKGLDCDVVNENESTGGDAQMDDEEYRAVLKENYLVHRRGTQASYDEFFRSYDGLSSYKIVPLWNGVGTLKVIIDAAENIEYHVNQVREGILEEVCCADEDITVVSAKKQPIKINIVIDVDVDEYLVMSEGDKEHLKSQLVDAVYVYFNGGSLPDDNEIQAGMEIGEDFIPFRLAVWLDLAFDEIDNITIKNPSDVIPVEDNKVISIDNKEDIEITIN